MARVFDLKSLVKELSERLEAIFEQDGSGFAIEVPLARERYQSVSVFADANEVELLTTVHELDKAAKSTIEKYQKLAKGVKVTLEPDPDGDSYHASVRAVIPLAQATRAKVQPLLLEVATLGDGIESELTGGDVD
jgi:hypothetical protein